MGARVGASLFWCFLILNALAAAGLTHLMPESWALPTSHYQDIPLPGVPLKPIFGFLFCLPTAVMGVRRLHDIGRAGWPVLLPFLALACLVMGPVIVPPLALTLIGLGRDGVITVDPHLAGKITVATLMLGGLFLAAGTLRTLFLWLQPGDPDRNVYGPAPRGDTASTHGAAPAGHVFLTGRMRRLPFWLLLAANVALIYGLRYTLNHEPKNMAPSNLIDMAVFLFAPYAGAAVARAQLISLLTTILYLPALWAAVLRLHDQDRSGLLVLGVLALNLIAPFGESVLTPPQIDPMNAGIDILVFYLLFLCLQPGNIGDNGYGPSPGEDAAPQAPAKDFNAPPRPAAAMTASVARSVTARTGAPRSFGRRGT